MKPIANPRFANLFFHLFDATKFNTRGTSCFLGEHARTNVFLYQQFEVGMNLQVEVRLYTSGQEEVSQKTSRFHKERHAETPLYDASKA